MKKACVAVLPSDHLLAKEEIIRSEQIARETFAQWRDDIDENMNGPVVADLLELIPLVRLGRAITVLPRSLLGTVPPGISLVPVSDAESSRIVVARRDDDDSRSVSDFIDAALAAHGGRQDRRATR